MIDEKQKYVKIHCALDSKLNGVKSENLWAIILDDNKARIANIPFFLDEFSIDDIITIKEKDGVFVPVDLVEKVTIGYVLKWDGKKYRAKEDVNSIIAHFYNERVRTEIGFLGLAAIAVPISMTHEEIKKICNECPIEVELIKN